MSHWHSGLPKLDIEPFDPTPLYDAVKCTVAENAVVEERRRSTRRTAAVLGLVFATCAIAGFVLAHYL
ncbi:MAG: hypothetical protein IE926_00865 [Micrococcales bacterium]|uniref:hypothetical protein n=1 Tax=Phycicoccus sp. TaxID=1902410 RepID=UPI001997766C|nr:hypothetical protein [Phycicoccus sp.]MBD3781496.1 hypothetical protein [Micrococcales bacterium]HMM93733.1 hypothetical protein [Phycicoccus sp.]